MSESLRFTYRQNRILKTLNLVPFRFDPFFDPFFFFDKPLIGQLFVNLLVNPPYGSNCRSWSTRSLSEPERT